MTRAEQGVLIVGAERYRLGTIVDGQPVIDRLDLPADASPAQIAESVAAGFAERGETHPSLVLAAASSWCFWATIDTARLPRRRARQAMVYRLEEHLPVSAEQIVADFVQAGDHAIGVAAMLERLSPLISALESAGIYVSHVCPTALLALQYTLHVDGSANVYVWQHDSQLDVLAVRDGHLSDWAVLPAVDADLQTHLTILSEQLDAPLRIAAGDVAPPLADCLSKMPDVQSLDAERPGLFDQAVRAAADLSGATMSPWIDLRRGQLAARDPLRQIRGPLSAAVAALVLLAVSLCGGMLWRAGAYQNVIDANRQRQLAAVEQVLPGRDVEAHFADSRLAAELRSLQQRHGRSPQTTADTPSLTLLHGLLSRLPTMLRFRITELQIDGDRILIEGETRTHGDAEVIASALRRGDVFTVETPATQALRDKGVAFTLQATVRKAQGSPGGAG